jgi:hypothetical protein
VWNDALTDVRLKKRVVQSLIGEVMVDVDDPAAAVVAVLHWKGGVHTELRLPCRRRGYGRAHTPKEIVDAVRVLVRSCWDDTSPAFLTSSGLVTGMGNRWTRELVTSLRSHHGIPAYSGEHRRIEAEHPLANGPWVLQRRALETDRAVRFIERIHTPRRKTALPASDQSIIDFSATSSSRYFQGR